MHIPKIRYIEEQTGILSSLISLKLAVSLKMFSSNYKNQGIIVQSLIFLSVHHLLFFLFLFSLQHRVGFTSILNTGSLLWCQFFLWKLCGHGISNVWLKFFGATMSYLAWCTSTTGMSSCNLIRKKGSSQAVKGLGSNLESKKLGSVQLHITTAMCD